MKSFRDGFRYQMRREWDNRYKNVALVVGLLLLALLGAFTYSSAYNNSAEAVTIYVSDKWAEHHTDEDGWTTHSYVVVGNGEEFNCGSLGKKGSAIFHKLIKGDRYEVVVAGLGVLRRDIVAVNRHIPKPDPAPILIRENEPEAE